MRFSNEQYITGIQPVRVSFAVLFWKWPMYLD